MYSKSGRPIKQCRGHVLCMVLTAYNGCLGGGGCGFMVPHLQVVAANM